MSRAERRARREKKEAIIEEKLRKAYADAFAANLESEMTPQERHDAAVQALMDEGEAFIKTTPPQEMEHVRAAARAAQSKILEVLKSHGATEVEK